MVGVGFAFALLEIRIVRHANSERSMRYTVELNFHSVATGQVVRMNAIDNFFVWYYVCVIIIPAMTTGKFSSNLMELRKKEI